MAKWQCAGTAEMTVLTRLVTAGLILLAGPAFAQETGYASGRVLADSTEAAIAGATVSIPHLRVAATSDSLGRFALRGIAPGEHLVIVRRLGFSPLSTVLQFAAGDSVDADFLLEPVPQRLSNVDVRGAGVSRKLAEFEERRVFGIGHFLTTEEIEKTGATRVSEVLRVLPGLQLVRMNGRGDMYVGSTRGAQSLLRAGAARPCPAEIVLDGIVVATGATNINGILAQSDIAAIEWYAGAAQIPAKYGGTKNTCAVLVLWTK